MSRMYRTLFRLLADACILGAAGMTFFYISAPRANLPLLVGLFALYLIVTILRMIPLLRVESLTDEAHRLAKQENAPPEILDVLNRDGKPTPIFSLQTVFIAAFILALGFLMRMLR